MKRYRVRMNHYCHVAECLADPGQVLELDETWTAWALDRGATLLDTVPEPVAEPAPDERPPVDPPAPDPIPVPEVAALEPPLAKPVATEAAALENKPKRRGRPRKNTGGSSNG